MTVDPTLTLDPNPTPTYQAFIKEPSFEPLLRLLALLLQRFGENAKKEDEHFRSDVSSVSKLTQALVAVAEVLTEMQGDTESGDYWTYSASLEVACIKHVFGQATFAEVVVKTANCLAKATYPGALKVTHERLGYARKSFASQGEEAGEQSYTEAAERLLWGARCGHSNSDVAPDGLPLVA